MTRIWNELEGVSIAGKYSLERCLGTEQDAAFFGLTADPDQPKAVVKLMHAQAAEAEQQLAAWRQVQELSHPHLLALLDCGETEAASEPWIYGVFEHPDDTLANAIAAGSVGDAEAQDVLPVVRDALRYTHEHGLIHGSVDADHVVAVGDRIKLTSDTLRNSSDLESAVSVDLLAVDALGRKLHVVSAVASEPEPVAPSPPLTPAPAFTEPPVVPAFVEQKREAGRRAPALLLAGAVGALVIAVLLAATQRSTPSAPSTPAATPVSRPAQPTPVSAPAPAQTQVAFTPPSKPAKAERWRVVAYTYNHRGQAEKKAQTVNRKYPGFDAAVFAPRGSSEPYFVALGGPMSRERAAALQKKARAKGLPRDTFIRNYAN